MPNNDSGGGYFVKIFAFTSGISRVPNRTNQASLPGKGLRWYGITLSSRVNKGLVHRFNRNIKHCPV
ncbi:MAG: hypothetical protein ACUVTU_07395, partial [Desulfurispora sp.]|uniref:hypothetical protein n=1 Tax=Desulfurispora sp. TaxID=3014275 RepID=UPI004049E21D